MIEPTEEMIRAHETARRAYWDSLDYTAGVNVAEHEPRAARKAMEAVLAIVERDYPIGPIMCDAGPHPTEPLAYCELPRGHKGKHSATVERAVDW